MYLFIYIYMYRRIIKSLCFNGILYRYIKNIVFYVIGDDIIVKNLL